MSIFDSLFRSQADQVRALGQARMAQQSRAAGRTVAAASNRGAVNPAALAAEVNRAQQEERSRVGADTMAQLLAAQEADRQRGERIAGGLLSTAGQIGGQLVTAMGGAPAAATVGGAAGAASPLLARPSTPTPTAGPTPVPAIAQMLGTQAVPPRPSWMGTPTQLAAAPAPTPTLPLPPVPRRPGEEEDPLDALEALLPSLGTRVR